MSERPLIVIQSGNAKFLGLSTPEWAIISGPYMFSLAIIQVGTLTFWIYTLVYIIAILAYGQLISKLEQDALGTFMKNNKIPDTVVGFFENTIPIDIEKGEESDNNSRNI